VFVENTDTVDTRVLSVVDDTPDANGQVRSVMSNYLFTRSQRDAFVSSAIASERLNARPTIYTSSKTDSVFDERELASYRELTRATNVQNDMEARTKLSVAAHALNERIVARLNARDPSAVVRERTDPFTGLPHFDALSEETTQPVVPLPLDAVVATVPRPESRVDVLGVLTHAQQTLCVIMGVNPESVGGNTRSSGHMGEKTLERAVSLVTQETTARWARLFAPVLVKLYSVIWDKEDVKKWDELDNGELTVVFPSTLPEHLIQQLFANRVLSYDAYLNYVGRLAQMPADAFEKQDWREKDQTAETVKRLKV
jgi:hypothetical protein